MLVVFYCNSESCRRVHFRTDERDKTEHCFCPRCGNRMRMLCDFNSWIELNLSDRKLMIEKALDLNSDKFFRKDIKPVSGTVLIEGKKLSELDVKQFELKTENKRLRMLANGCRADYSNWKKRMVLYHDELWKLLSENEPEKYSRDCPK